MKNNTKSKNPFPEMDGSSSTTQCCLKAKSEDIGWMCRKEFGNSSTNNLFFSGRRGFPSKCVCGSDVTIYTSSSKANPGRPYFRCAVSRDDGHLFKWVEDGLYEEVKDLIQKFGKRESESENVMRNEENELMLEVLNLKEEVVKCKTELRNVKISVMLVLILCVGVIAFVIIYHIIFGQIGEKSLVFGT